MATQTGLNRSRLLIVVVLLAGLVALAAGAWRFFVSPSTVMRTNVAQFVGSQACAGCHRAESQAWQGSHHHMAMQTAEPSTVLAPFHGETMTDGGIISTFSREQNKFLVRTDGSEGRMAKFQVTHTLGVYPLQQYLVSMPGGALQALGMAWDARPRAAGGQRWFPLHAGEHLHAGDPLHWSGRQNNWNAMCADCHTTGFHKGYDADTQSYRSTWSELGAGCEACHGPGSRHLAWAALPQVQRAADPHRGLAQSFDRRASWRIDAATGNAVRSAPPPSPRKEVELCARCHAHRSQIAERAPGDQSLLDTYIPSLLETELFWSDGQMKAEVFNYASFEQSRMFRKGVRCGDCHDQHSLALRLPGNATCLQCHAAAKYDNAAHHHHDRSSAGASCAACHMPPTTYMKVDPRHDHSIRVPRPDLSLKNGTPNACSQCHTGKSVEWADRQARAWYPGLAQRPTALGDALQTAARGDPRSMGLLLAIARDRDQSPVSRASALVRLHPGASTVDTVRRLLSDDEPLVRLAATEVLAAAPVTDRLALRPLLEDPVKGVRIAAARGLASVQATDWTERDKSALAHATEEYLASQHYNADRPEAWNNLAMFHADQGKDQEAENELKRAIGMAPDFTASELNLADLYRTQGRDEDAEHLLKDTVTRHPMDANAHYALGLTQWRLKHTGDALYHLRRAAELDPHNTLFTQAYAMAHAAVLP